MNRETALRLLGLSGAPSPANVNAAKRGLLTALHPDKHPAGQHPIFARLSADIIEAADLLLAGPSPDPRNDDFVAAKLFDIRAADTWNRVAEERGVALARFDHRYATDKILGVAILGLDPGMNWNTTNRFTGEMTDHFGTALYIVAYNRTKRRVEGLDIQKGVLIDDLGHQYSSDGIFYWSTEDGTFNHHSSDLAPNAKLDGFLLYPALRPGASFFARWFFADSFKVTDKYLDGEYDIELPQEPQRLAMLAAGTVDSRLGDNDFSAEDDNDEDDDDEEEDDSWLYEETKP